MSLNNSLLPIMVKYTESIKFKHFYAALRAYYIKNSSQSVSDAGNYFDREFLLHLTLVNDRMEKLVTTNYVHSIHDKFHALHYMIETESAFASIRSFCSILRDVTILSTADEYQQNTDECQQQNQPTPTQIMDTESVSENLPQHQEKQLVYVRPNLKRTVNGQSKRSNNQSAKVHFVRESAKSMNLDKTQKEALSNMMKSVVNYYPHYKHCQSCELCEQAFKSLDITRCSKRHGGNPCNTLGLYPHASETYLYTLHQTKKLVVMPGQGYANPLAQKVLSSSEQKNTPSNQTHTNVMQSSKSDHLTRYQNTRGDLEFEREYVKQQNGMFWKLKHDSPDALYQRALARFKNLKRYIPGYQVPSWATCASKVLYDSLVVADARHVAQNVHEKRQNSKSRRLNKRCKFT
jgi:hypothetical protein